MSVAAMPPLTSSSVLGKVEPIPTLSLVPSATRRLVLTSSPFLTTKFLLIAIWVHFPPFISYYLLRLNFYNHKRIGC